MFTLGVQARAIGSGYAPAAPGSYSKAMRALVKTTGIPEWKRREMRQDAADQARVLDPDIASFQSVSLAKKYRMQCDRNYQRAVNNLSTDGILEEARQAFFQKINGLG